MQRALELARHGEGFTSPNPMVGAVITNPAGEIIGEGWHRRFGGPHAEVNAVRSVKNPEQLKTATIYVTLEPCSHYGKTPPCARLLIESGFRRVVVGAPDPNPLVAGRGIRMLREAGIEVTENVLLKDCLEVNRRFMTAQILRRPYIQLKWARSVDGFMAAEENGHGKPVKFSTPLTSVLMHRERALADGIMVGTGTLLADNPSLTLRHFPGHSPRPVIFNSARLSKSLKLFETAEPIMLDPARPLAENMQSLFTDFNLSSLMVEGGATLLQSFINEGLFDEIRVEIAPVTLGKGIPAPAVPSTIPFFSDETINGRRIVTYKTNFPHPKNPKN